MQTIMWEPVSGIGCEMLFLNETRNGVFADSVVVGVRNGRPFRLRYRLECDEHWNTRLLDVTLLSEPMRNISIRAVGTGKWTNDVGERLEVLDGCIDVDLAASPFTNTLPIRRIRFGIGESRDFRMAYVGLPDLELSAVEQRYTCMKVDGTGAVYNYEGIFRKFRADLQVDSQGIVSEYPMTWKRITPGVE